MGYVISEILGCLLIATAIGFFLGWYWQWLGWRKKETNLEELFSSRLEESTNRCERLQAESEGLARKLAKAKEEHKRVLKQLRALREPASGESGGESMQSKMTPKTGTGKAPLFYTEPPERIDNLKRLSGVGPVLEKMLNRLGIYQFDQIAAFSDADVARVAPELGAFRGRITRDNWVDQARKLIEERETP